MKNRKHFGFYIFNLLFFIILIFDSCDNELGDINKKEVWGTTAQRTMQNYFNERKNGLSVKDGLYKYHEKSRFKDTVKLYITENMMEGLSNSLTKENVEIQYFWNQEIKKAELYDWAYDSVDCDENLLVFTGTDTNREPSYCFCFDSTGKIVSTIPLYNPNTNEIDWK